MKLKELKDWLNSLPEKFDEYDVVNGEVGTIDGEYMYRVDKPITTLTIDEQTKEFVILNDTQDEIENGDTEQPKA